MRLLAISTVLALACGVGLASAEGVEPTEGAYKGKTAQGFPVYFGVKGRTVVNPRYTVRWGYCGKSPVHWPKSHGEIDEAGHFIIDGGQTAIEGTFTGPSQVEGITLFREHPLVGCPERAIPFTAHLRHAAPAAGS